MEATNDEAVGTNGEYNHPLMVSSIRERLENLSPPSKEICIYKVNETLRRTNPEAYTPVFVSIGPFHHGKPGLEAMEEAKWRYVQTFLHWSGMSLEDLVKYIEDVQELAWNYYAIKIDFSRDKFVEIMLVDAVFLIVLLVKCFLGEYDDFLLRGPLSTSDLDHDLLLLENQLPFFILKDLFEVIIKSQAVVDLFGSKLRDLTVVDLVCEFFNNLGLNKDISTSTLEFYNPRHFVDLLRKCHLPTKLRVSPTRNGRFNFPRNLTQLHEAGVKMKLSPSKNYADLEFANGELKIPFVEIQEKTEVLLRNLVAFEHCHHQKSKYITDYVIIMDSLVTTPADVELLCENEILANDLCDSLEAKMFSRTLAGKLYSTFQLSIMHCFVRT